METEERFEREETRRETDIKCPNCGATVDFDPEAQGLICEYCGYRAEIPSAEAGETVEEMDFSRAEQRASHAWGAEKKVVICKSCGAESIYDALEIADTCPYCGANHVMEEKDENSLAPGGVCPFEVGEKRAGQNFLSWLRKKLFVPTKAKRQAKAGALTGVYLPYWTFDALASSNYTAQAGKTYTVRVGKTTQTRTRWWPVSGFYQEFFDDILIEGSSRHDPAFLKKVQPFQFGRAQTYKPEYLSGFIAERYSVGLEEGWQQAKGRMMGALKKSISKEIMWKNNANRVGSLSFSTSFGRITYKYLLVPIWISSFTYRGKSYQFLVNGQTGKVGGKAPVSGWKVGIAVLIGIAAFVLLALAGKYF